MIKNPPLAEVPIGAFAIVKTNRSITYVDATVTEADPEGLTVRVDFKMGSTFHRLPADSITNLVIR
jgi:hypothetical protein